MAAVNADMKVHQFGVTVAQRVIAVHGPQLRDVQGTVLDVLIDPLLPKKMRHSRFINNLDRANRMSEML